MGNYKYRPEECVDELVSQFHRNGYLTLRRRFGKYLSEPEPIGDYKVDAIGKYKKKYVLGIVLYEKDFNDEKLVRKLSFLASRRSKYSNTSVTLFVGVAKELMPRLQEVLRKIEEPLRRNIKPVVFNPPEINNRWSKN